MSKIVVENAVKRKVGWIYWIDTEGNLLGYDIKKRQRERAKTHQAGQRVRGSSKALQKRPCTRKGSASVQEASP